MKRIKKLKLLLGLLWAALLLSAAYAPSLADAGASMVTGAEAWRTGNLVAGPLSESMMAGRGASAGAAFRSDRGFSDMYFLLKAPAHAVQVTAARLYLVQRSGAYAGTASLSLEGISLTTRAARLISMQDLDVESAQTGGWLDLQLSTDADARWINPGEVLAFHFHLDGAPSGDLQAYIIFDLAVDPAQTHFIYLPLCIVSDTD